MSNKPTDSDHTQLLMNIEDVAKTSAGVNVLWNILGLCNIYSYTPDGNAFYDGQRSIGIAILEMMEEVDPTLYPRLLLERSKLKE